jgi:hypothetical protein
MSTPLETRRGAALLSWIRTHERCSWLGRECPPAGRCTPIRDIYASCRQPANLGSGASTRRMRQRHANPEHPQPPGLNQRPRARGHPPQSGSTASPLPSPNKSTPSTMASASPTQLCLTEPYSGLWSFASNQFMSVVIHGHPQGIHRRT